MAQRSSIFSTINQCLKIHFRQSEIIAFNLPQWMLRSIYIFYKIIELDGDRLAQTR